MKLPSICNFAQYLTVGAEPKLSAELATVEMVDKPIAVVIEVEIEKELWSETVAGNGRCLRL